jgi:YegS/Rv2252/BmrU family lipid kinase
MPTLLLVNPVAGHGRGARLLNAARDACARHWREVRVAVTTAPGEGIDLARQAGADGCDRILALGGDGTVHEAANGILALPSERRPALGVIPSGTGNDYAKLSGTYRAGVDEAVRRLAHARVVRLDAGRAWGEYFINSIGIGFDAEVARRVGGYRRLRGAPAYLLAAFATFRAFDAPTLEVEGDGISFREPTLLLEVGIGNIVGGGFRLTPNARPDDGLFDVCAIRRLGLFGFLGKLPLAMLGWHGGLSGVRMFRATRLVVQGAAGQPIVAQFDGELRTGTGPVTIDMVPAALPVLLTA